MKVIMIVRAILNVSKEKDQVLMIVMAPTGMIIQHEYAVLKMLLCSKYDLRPIIIRMKHYCAKPSEMMLTQYILGYSY